MTVSPIPFPVNSPSIGSTTALVPTVSVTSDSTPFTFTVFTSSNALGQNWLTVSPNHGTSGDSFTLSANLQGFAPGTYTGTVTVDSNGTSNSHVTFNVTITAQGVDALQATFSPKVNQALALSYPSNPNGSITVTSSDPGHPLYFSASPTVGWLSVMPSGPLTNSVVSILAQPGSMAAGTYAGSVVLADTNNVQTNISVSLVVSQSSPTLSVSCAPCSGTGPAGQTISIGSLSVSNSTTLAAIAFTVSTATNDGTNWLHASPSGASTPATVSLSADLRGLAQGAHSGSVTVMANGVSNGLQTFNVNVTVTAATANPTQTISHVAFGGGWQTSIILVNLDTVSAQYTINFWNEDGTPGAVPLAGGAATTGTIQPGFSQTIETAGLGNLTEGWAEVVSSQQIGGTAIFRNTTQNHTQEAAVPLLTSGGTKLFLPFDVGGGFALGIGIANPSSSTDAQITLTLRTEQGSTIPLTVTDPTAVNSSPGVSLPLAKRSHKAFLAAPLNATGEVRGVIEIDSNVPIFALGIRYNGLAFTSIDSVTAQPASTKTISHIAFGGGWQTTVLPVNTDSVMASYTINFSNDDGTTFVPLAGGAATTGTIQPGSSQTIATAGLPGGNVLEGWAEVSSSQQIGGTAIFSDTSQNHTQEAAVPLLTSGGTKLFLPFDVGGGFALGIGIANPSSSTDAQITLTLRTEQGSTIPLTITDPTAVNSSPGVSLPLAKRSHKAFLAAPLNATGEVRGVIEIDSSVPIFALGIRYNGLAFTSIRALGN